MNLRTAMPLLIVLAGGPSWLLAAPIDAAKLPSAAAQKVDFAADIQPIFSAHCYRCHGPDKQRNNFRLDVKAAALKGGDDLGPDIVPGKSAESPLIHLVSGAIEGKIMPKEGDRLTTTQIGLLRAWIDQGANWPEELATGAKGKSVPWAIKPLTRPMVPHPKNSSWAANPIDAFILARLEQNGLSPSRSADKATLLRRATLDLHGLPPSEAELDAFAADRSPLAFARVVERLLSSPRYGERWARHWLDIARFGESHGFEYDKIRDHAWPYRDYVIQSFNQDKPYYQFVREQIAGDVLEPITSSGIVATEFLVCAPWDEAGNSQVSKLMKARIREEEIEDMISVVGQTFLGLTVQCARCHDHKFDLITQRDYYSLKAVLAGVRPGNRSRLSKSETKQRQDEIAAVQREIEQIEHEKISLEGVARKRLEGQAANAQYSRAEKKSSSAILPLLSWDFQAGAKGLELKGGATIANGQLVLDGKSGYAESAPLPRELHEKTLEAWATLGTLEQSGGAVLSLEAGANGGIFDAIVFGEREPRHWMAGSEFFHRTRELHKPAASAGNKSEAQAIPPENASPDALVHLAVVYAKDNSVTFYRNGQLLAEPYIPTGDQAELQAFPAGQTRLLFGLRHHGAKNGFLRGSIARANLYDRALTKDEIRASFKTGPRVLTPEALMAAFTPREALDYQKNRERITAASKRLYTLTNNAPLVYAANPVQPEATFVLRRGEVDKPREEVTAAPLSCLRGLPSDFNLATNAPEAERRLALAAWISEPRNPLTARVIVNRLWQYHFGRGIVGTPNDFGANGELPSNPELLDWLASEFLARGSSLKEMHRLILMSNTYQQGGRPLAGTDSFAAKAEKIDADNRMLWHFSIQRMEGEVARDSMLWLSGNLNSEMGGPGFRPFTIFINNSHFYTLTNRWEPAYNRRTIYRINVQSARDPLLDSLDCPDPSTKTPARAITTTPIQSLGLMNNEFVLREAADFATRLKMESGDHLRDQIAHAYRLAFARQPSGAELQRAERFAKENGLESLCWVLVNSSEFLYIK